MQMDRLTIKAAEAVQRAHQMAQDAGNPEVTPLHLLAALVSPETDGTGGIVAACRTRPAVPSGRTAR
jgi:ATP-dependent Clp protease ATP-binding subunit ClpA